MQLTMAMGLKYEPGAGVSLLTDFKHGQENGSARPENGLPPPVGQVIDIDAVEVREGRLVEPGKSCHFDYLVYDLKASLIAVPIIGSRLSRVA